MTKNTPVPVASPQGDLMMYAGRYARDCVLTAFEMIGGVDAMADWARENQTDFYTKVFTKTIVKQTENREHNSVEELLKELDANMIDVTPDEVSVAPQESSYEPEEVDETYMYEVAC